MRGSHHPRGSEEWFQAVLRSERRWFAVQMVLQLASWWTALAWISLNLRH